MIRIQVPRLATIAVAFAIVGGAFAQSLAQRAALWITSPHVALDLKLTSAQLSQRSTAVSEFEAKRNEIVAKMQSEGQVEARHAELDQLSTGLEKKLLAILTPPQQKRLRQIAIQQFGVESMADPGVAAELQLTAAQKAKVKSVQDRIRAAQDAYETALSDALDKLPDPGAGEMDLKAYEVKQKAIVASMKPKERQYHNTKAAGDKELVAMLTPVQKKKWVAIQGKTLKPG